MRKDLLTLMLLLLVQLPACRQSSEDVVTSNDSPKAVLSPETPNPNVPAPNKSMISPPKITELTNSIGMKLVRIPAGTFQMGSPIEEYGAISNEEQYTVKISNAFYLGKFEVTQGQYAKVMGLNPSYFQKRVIRKTDSSMYPVDSLYVDFAVEFCNRLSEMPEEKRAGRSYRLPTEAEWEYACRAGSTTAYSFGDDASSLDKFAWFKENSDGQTHPVGSKEPNAWGLYDMHGNVWEWCADRYGEYPRGMAIDPISPQSKKYPISRGGNFDSLPIFCRSAYRGDNLTSSRTYEYCGFRVLLTVSESAD
jgi:formylglycine-generating enzyme required for sulfatase activity